MFIYKITNIQNNKSYIGQTITTPEARWKRHQQDALSNRLNTHFAQAIRKYGVDNFILEVIDTAKTQEELTEKESFWIKHYNSIDNGYNETDAKEKSGGNTYKSKTEKELKEIGLKIAATRMGGLNVNAKKVKCRSIKTGEEYHFDSQADMQTWFNAPNHIFISRRCLGKIKKPYLDEWEIAFEQDEYGAASKNPSEKDPSRVPKCSSITVKNLETQEEKTFKTYAEAERYFELKPKCLSAKASKKPNIFIYKEKYQVTKHYN